MFKKICLFVTLIAVLFALTGCFNSKKDSFEDLTDDELFPVSSIMLSEEEAMKINDKVPLYLYFADNGSKMLKKEIRYIPIEEAKKSVENLASCIITELIKGPSKETGLSKIMPEGTVLNKVEIDKRVITIDLSKQFVDNHPGGKDMEELTIYSICNSLTELKEIDKVKFTIDGKTVKEFKGNFKFNAEFPRNEALISKKSNLKGTTDESAANEQSVIEGNKDEEGSTTGELVDNEDVALIEELDDSEETVELLE